MAQALIRLFSRTCLWSIIAVLPLFASANEIFTNRDVPLIDNRFRLDHGIEKITFILYREEGTRAAVLVRPNGSKLYAWDLPENATWLETDEMDIVTIENPMPGPWQAVAENRGRNRIQLLSDVALEVDEIPTQLYFGERLKIAAQLHNRGDKIDLGVYIDEALLSVAVNRTVNIDLRERIRREELAKFYDDGKKFDEVPDDGIFTAVVDVDIEPGKYELVVSTINEVFTRALRQEVFIYPNPVSVKIDAPDDDSNQAVMHMQIDRDELDPSSVIIDGKVFNNVGWEEPFQVFAETDKIAVPLPTPAMHGRYRVGGTILANTLDGRELVVEFPEEDFVILPPPPPPVAPEVLEQAAEAEEPSSPWGMIIGIVFGVLLLVGAVFGFIWWRKRVAFKKALEKARQSEAPAMNGGPEPKMSEGPELNMPEE